MPFNWKSIKEEVKEIMMLHVSYVEKKEQKTFFIEIKITMISES